MMQASAREALLNFSKIADLDLVLENGIKIEEVLNSKPMNDATAAMCVAGMVGWFIRSLSEESMIRDFENLIDAHIWIALAPEPNDL